MVCDITKTVKEIPLYQQLYGDRIEDFDLHNNYKTFPDIEKRDVARNFPANWMSTKLRGALLGKEVEYNASSGTTSERMQIVRMPAWWALENKQTYAFDDRLALLNNGHRKAVLTTAICSNTVCFATLPTYQKRIIGTTLYLNISPDPNAWQKQDIERVIDEINQYEPDILDVDPIYLAHLLRFREIYKITKHIHRPKIIIYTYEYVTAYAKKYCDAYFDNVDNITFYGSTETGYNLFQLPGSNQFKHVQDRCYLDLLPIQDDVYALKITSWKNPYMPLVNYKINDLVRVENPPGPGDAGPLIIDQLCGRVHDLTVGAFGRMVCVGDIERALHVVEADILFYQLRFFSPTQADFRYVTATDEPLNSSRASAIKEVLYELYGSEFKLRLSCEKSISPEMSGKFSVVKKE